MFCYSYTGIRIDGIVPKECAHNPVLSNRKDLVLSEQMLVLFQLDILAKFESRIHKLEDTIVPVHQETEDLQRRQASILLL